MSQVTFQDLLDQVNDFCQNYSVSNIDLGNKKRTANRAIEYVQRQLGLPSDKQILDILFFEDEMFYDAPSGFNEMIQVYYYDKEKNTPQNRWLVYKDIEILRNSSDYGNKTSYTSINGKNQIMLEGNNTISPETVSSLDSLTNVSVSSSVTNIVLDYDIYKNIQPSIKFGLDNSETSSTITVSTRMDIRSVLNKNGRMRMWQFIPLGVDTTKISSIELRLLDKDGNYYSSTTSTQSNGDAWEQNDWNKISFNFAFASSSGIPDGANIVNAQIIYNHNTLFTNVEGFRISQLYAAIPDRLSGVYYTAYKGTDSTGTVAKINLTEGDDLIAFGAFAPDLIIPVALKATLWLLPQLKGSTDFWSMYKTDYTDSMKLWSRTYPRQRTITSGTTQIIRR